MWPTLTAELLKPFPKANGDSALPPDCQTEPEGWKLCIDSLLDVRALEPDWDGQGTDAPPPDVVDSAMILAVMLRERGIRPPTSALQGVNRDVFFEWQWWDLTTLILEVTAPYEAGILLHKAGGTTEYQVLREPAVVA